MNIKEQIGFGKYVENTKKRELGEIVLKIKTPVACAIQPHLIKSVCYYCFSISTDTNNPTYNKFKVSKSTKNYIIGCNKCDQVYFCSDECFSKSMSLESFNDLESIHIHTPLECLIFSFLKNSATTMLTSNKESTHDQTENRMIISYFSKIAYSKSFEKFSRLENEISLLIGDIGDDTHFREKELKSIKNRSFSIRKLFKQYFNFQIDDGIIEEMYAKTQRNAFGLWKDSHNCFGLSMYCNGASFFNHSCFPSLLRVQNKQSIEFITIVPDISIGQELSISYIDIGMSTSNRLDLLLSCYCFICNCKRCNISTITRKEHTEMEELINKLRCKNKAIQCTGTLYTKTDTTNSSSIRICNFCKQKEEIIEVVGEIIEENKNTVF